MMVCEPGGMQIDLTGRVAVITGAARGIGAGLVAAFADAGAAVLALDRDEPAADARPPGNRVAHHTVDVARWDEVADAAARAVRRWGRLDVWINCAGVFPYARLGDVTADQMTTTFAVNVHAAVAGAQAAAEHLTRGGSVINISSIAAARARAGRLAYGTSKAALEHATRALAVEFASRGVRVNAVAPGYIDTAMLDWAREDGGLSDLASREVWLGRIGEVGDVANASLFLASDAASYITGVVLPVDGGLRASAGGSMP